MALGVGEGWENELSPKPGVWLHLPLKLGKLRVRKRKVGLESPGQAWKGSQRMLSSEPRPSNQ